MFGVIGIALSLVLLMLLAIVLSCAILTYGGASLFVVAFAVYSIAAALFRESGVPKRFIPGAITLGSFTFTMTALPGTLTTFLWWQW